MLSDGVEAEVRCSACASSSDVDERRRLFTSADRLWSHIAMTHVHWLPFECIICPLTCMPTENVLKHHYQLVHPGKTPKAIYTYEESKKMEIKRIFDDSNQLYAENASDYSTLERLHETISSRHASTSMCYSTPENFAKRQPFPKESTESEQAPDQEWNSAESMTSPETPFPTHTDTWANEAQEAIQVDTDAAENDTKPPHSTPSRGQKWCRLCHQDILVNRSSRHIWQCHLSEQRRFSCNHCAFSTSQDAGCINSHVRNRHKEKNGVGWTNHTIELYPQYARAFKAAFGAHRHTTRSKLLTESSLEQHDRIAVCKLCDVKCTPAQRNGHIWSRHVSGERFTCNVCGEGSWSTRLIRDHARVQHERHDAECWRDNTKELMGDFQKQFLVAFGTDTENQLP